MLLLSIVNYIDEYLTSKNTVNSELEKKSIHKQVGGLIIASTLAGFIGAIAISFFGEISFSKNVILLSSFAGIGSAFLYISYFYLLAKFPVWQVVPLFQMSTIWLLIIELLLGETISLTQIIAIVLILAGAYVVDTGSLKWKIPGKLLLYMIPVTISWSFSLLAIKEGIIISSVTSVSFWEFLTVGIIGLILLFFVKPFREGFVYRSKTQGKVFLGGSFLNESLSLSSYFLNNLAVALAPLAAFVSALSGIQGVFLLFIFLLFPLKKERIKKIQILAIVIIATGVFMISR